MAKHYVSNKDETARMFKSDLLEAFSKVHWTVPLWVFIPIISFFFYRAFFTFGMSLTSIAGYFILGLFIWTITEYLLHRFVFHFPAKTEFGKRIHFIFHGVHHDYPNDTKRLVMPPSVSLPLATLFYFLFLFILGGVSVNPFFAGFLIGYLFYDIIKAR
jgi:sterol desaturase/sphingolipid hydroxylase (fatty acid hydroxylase superfamily)